MIRLQKKHVLIKPEQGLLASALGKFNTGLSNAKYNNPEFKNALKFVKQWHEKVLSNDLSEGDQPSTKRFCKSGAARNSKRPKKVMFVWFIDVRETLKSILPLKMF